jgi:hypothetical protein
MGRNCFLSHGAGRKYAGLKKQYKSGTVKVVGTGRANVELKKQHISGQHWKQLP